MTGSRWRRAAADPAAVEDLAARGMPPLAAAILCALVDEPAKREIFLAAGPPDFPEERSVPGLSAAVDRLWSALERRETILVHGDYDVDGLAGAAVLAGGLRALGGQVGTFVPSRFEGGYGLSETSVQAAVDAGASLLVTADCGTNARSVGESLAGAGVDLVVTDHHTPAHGEQPPGPVVNPHLEGGPPELRALCGASVAYLLVRALALRTGRALPEEPFLRLLAIATVADVVPISALNRRICKEGFKALATTPNPGLALMLGRVNAADGVASHHVGYHLAPRFNAAGRIEDAHLVLELFLERDAARAARLVGRLEAFNETRKNLQAAAYEGASAAARSQAGMPVVFAASAGWHKGVIGPVAARLAERSGRSAFVVALEGEEGTGSARASAGDDVTARLAACAPLLERFGGHTGAAGFSVRAERLSDLQKALQSAPATVPPPQQPYLELEPSALQEAWRALSLLDPLGPGVPDPVFALPGLSVRSVRVLKGRHLKWAAVTPGGGTLTLLAWDAAERGLEEGSLGHGATPLVRMVPELRKGGDPWYLQVEGVL